MMLDDTRCGLDTSSLHRTTSMDISLSKNFRLLSCHRDTSSNSFYPISKRLGVLFQHSSRNSSFALLEIDGPNPINFFNFTHLLSKSMFSILFLNKSYI